MMATVTIVRVSPEGAVPRFRISFWCGAFCRSAEEEFTRAEDADWFAQAYGRAMLAPAQEYCRHLGLPAPDGFEMSELPNKPTTKPTTNEIYDRP